MTFKGFAASLYSLDAGIYLFGIRTGEYFNPAIVVPPQGNRRRATQAGLFPLRSSWSFHDQSESVGVPILCERQDIQVLFRETTDCGRWRTSIGEDVEYVLARGGA